jgi:hypothetical protein
MIRKRRTWLALLFLAVCSIGIIIVIQNSPQVEPSYRGKTVESWINELPAESPPSNEDNALQALEALGTDGTIYLANALQNREPVPNKTYLRFFDILPRRIQMRLPQPDDTRNRRYRALYALYSLAFSGDRAIAISSEPCQRSPKPPKIWTSVFVIRRSRPWA